MTLAHITLSHGEKFGRLTVLGRARADQDGRVMWKVGCCCGTQFSVRTSRLMRGKVKACRECTRSSFEPLYALPEAGAVQDALHPGGHGFPSPLRCGFVAGLPVLADADMQVGGLSVV